MWVVAGGVQTVLPVLGLEGIEKFFGHSAGAIVAQGVLG